MKKSYGLWSVLSLQAGPRAVAAEQRPFEPYPSPRVSTTQEGFHLGLTCGLVDFLIIFLWYMLFQNTKSHSLMCNQSSDSNWALLPLIGQENL